MIDDLKWIATKKQDGNEILKNWEVVNVALCAFF